MKKIHYYVLARNYKVFDTFRKEFANPQIVYKFIFDASQVPLITNNHLAVLPEAWMHPNFDDIIDALQDCGIMDSKIEVGYELRF
jgi:hypothetical protein